jgi:LysM repeat protein
MLIQRMRRWSVLLCVLGTSVAAACSRPAPTPEPGAPQPPGQGHVQEQIQISPSAVPHTVPTSAPSPSPAYPGVYVGTPTPNPEPASVSNGTGLETYVVQPGQTLSWIALVFGCTVEEIVTANNLADANSIVAGQSLVIPITASETGPAFKLIPDSELVYSPAYIHFDLAGFVAKQGGYLANYSSEVEGRSYRSATA